MIGLIVLAGIFYRERAWFADIAFYFLWAYFALQLKERVLGRPYYLLASGMAVVQAAKSWLSAN